MVLQDDEKKRKRILFRKLTGKRIRNLFRKFYGIIVPDFPYIYTFF